MRVAGKVYGCVCVGGGGGRWKVNGEWVGGYSVGWSG